MADSDFDYDLFVIGAGSGGVRAARIAGGHGAKVAIAEEYRYGGTCVVRGCIPKKLFVYAAHFHEDFADAAGYGWTIPEAPRFDWQALVAAKDREIARLSGLYQQTLSKAGVEMFDGRAVIAGPHRIAVAGRTVTARYILIATGGAPVLPDIPGADLAITSNEAFHLETLPKRMIIVGGGYIATEFAGIFNGLGVAVTQLYRRDVILRGFDMDLRTRLMDIMRGQGVDFRLQDDVKAIARKGDALAVQMASGDVLETDAVMYAIGRDPLVADLGLEHLGVATNSRGAIMVDDYSRTNVDHVYAVGDVTDRIALTPVAIKEGHAFADTVFGNRPTRPDHETVPSAVFSMPPIGTVGPSEEDARARHGDVEVFTSAYRPLKQTLTPRIERSFAKMIVDKASQRVLAAHMLGPDAPEIIQGIAIAIKMGATKAQFDATVAIHPSSAEEFVLMR
ncbi:MAG: glutathione-disulfide reductase [Sphingomonadales bacterium]